MKLIPNWRRVLRHGASVRCLAMAGIFSGVEMALPILDQVIPIPRGLFAAMTFLAVCLGTVSRLIAQRKVSGDTK